jgi:hypothetical protein
METRIYKPESRKMPVTSVGCRCQNLDFIGWNRAEKEGQVVPSWHMSLSL